MSAEPWWLAGALLELDGTARRSQGIPSIVSFRFQNVHFHCKIHASRAQSPVGLRFERGDGGGGVELCGHDGLVEEACFGPLGPHLES